MKWSQGDAAQAGLTRESRRVRVLLGFVVACVVLLGAVSSAWAGVGFSVVPNLPPTLAVGQTAIPSS
ncbi:MAG: hypothetical protein ACR2KV_09725, partial [Solirubrobacteraceae bacterium]